MVEEYLPVLPGDLFAWELNLVEFDTRKMRRHRLKFDNKYVIKNPCLLLNTVVIECKRTGAGPPLIIVELSFLDSTGNLGITTYDCGTHLGCGSYGAINGVTFNVVIHKL
jgi:hypothetical protein